MKRTSKLYVGLFFCAGILIAGLVGWYAGRIRTIFSVDAAASPMTAKGITDAKVMVARTQPVANAPAKNSPNTPRSSKADPNSPTSPKDQEVADLVRRSATGDGQASYELSKHARSCQQAALALASASQMARISGQLSSSDGSGRPDKSGRQTALKHAEHALASADEQQKDCAVADANGKEITAADWIQKAIDQGSEPAKVCYVIAPDVYAPAPLSQEWHDWYSLYQVQGPQLIRGLVESRSAEGVIAAGLAYAGQDTQNGRPSLLSYATGTNRQLALEYLLWQRRYATGARAQAFGDVINRLQVELGPALASKAEAAAAAGAPLHWLPRDRSPSNDCTRQLYSNYVEFTAAAQPGS